MKNAVWTILVLCLIVGRACAEDRPNVLWITLEDTSTQFIGAYGNEQVKTPTIDELAADGVRFTSAFASSSVCSTARSVIITGVSAEAMGTGHHRSGYPIPDDIKGFPRYLRENGYYTTNNAKTDYNTSEESRLKKESWNECSSKAGWWGRQDEQPFFSVFNFMHCHQSRTMTWSWKQYKNKVYDKLSEVERISAEELEMPAFYRDSPEMRKQMTRVYNSICFADKAVAKLLKRLEDDGLRDDTIIFLYADHGEGIPNMKANSIAMSYRVPFVVWFPKKYQHLNPWGEQVVTDELVSFEDLAPTMLSITGLEIPDYMKGRPILGRSRKPAPEFVFSARHRCGEGYDNVRSVTDGKFLYSRVFMPQYPAFKYHKYFDVGDISKVMRKDYFAGNLNSFQRQLFEPRAVEYLVDISNDRWESNNLAGDAEHQKRLEKMRQAVFSRIDQIRDVHFLPEYELDQIAKVGTAFKARTDTSAYPLEKIVEAASLVGSGRSAFPKQVEFLKDPHPVVRYWAAVGIRAQGRAVRSRKNLIDEAMGDSHPCVKIEMAALAWQLYRSPESKKIIAKQLGADNPYLVWQVVQGMIYMDDAAEELLPMVDQLRKDLKSNKKHPAKHTLVSSSIDMLFYKFREAAAK